MKRKRFSEEQIIAILREHESGFSTPDLFRKHGMSKGTFYAWKAKLAAWTSPTRRSCAGWSPKTPS